MYNNQVTVKMCLQNNSCYVHQPTTAPLTMWSQMKSQIRTWKKTEKGFNYIRFTFPFMQFKFKNHFMRICELSFIWKSSSEGYWRMEALIAVVCALSECMQCEWNIQQSATYRQVNMMIYHTLQRLYTGIYTQQYHTLWWW